MLYHRLAFFHNQIHGLAMISPLSSIFANTFMVFYESNSLNEYILKKSFFYLRYVDDILAVFEKEQGSLNFSIFLNNKHAHIKFTLEKQFHHFP